MTTRRGSPPPLDAAATWGQVVVLKGARTVIAAPDGTAAIAPFENPALATGRHGRRARGRDRLAPGPGPRAVRRGPARGLPARPGRATRSASGSATPASSRRTCPTAVADRPQAPGRDGRADGPPASGSGSGAVVPGDVRDDGRRRPSTAGAEPRRPIEDAARPTRRPAAAAADGVARDRPRRAGATTSPSCASLAGPGIAGPAGRQGRRLRPRRGPGRAGARGRPAPTGFCVAAVDEALELRGGRRSRPDPRPLSGPAGAWVAEAAAPRDRGHGRRPRRGSAETVRAAAPAGHRAGPLGIQLEVETGLGRGGLSGEDVAGCRARSIAGCAGRRAWPALWTHFQARRGRGRDGGAGRRASSARRRADRGGRDRPAGPPRRRERGAPDRATSSPTTASGPGLAVYGLVPDELATRRRRRPAPGRACARSCRCTPVRSGSRTCRPGCGHQLRPDVPDGPAEPDRDAAARLRRRLVAGPLEPRQRAGPRPAGPARRERGDGRGDGRRHRRARPPGRRRRRVRADRVVRATSGSPSRSWRGCAPRTRGRSSRTCPGGCLGCTMPPRGRSVCGRSPNGEG